MDNLAHTLVGAALGRAVAGRELPAAGWVGAIAGNAPDWAELLLQPAAWTARAGGEYLVYHRGITHSFVGAARGTRLGCAPPLGAGARVPRLAGWGHHAGAVAGPRSRRVVGTGGHGRMHRRRCDRLDAALVRRGGPAPRRSVRAAPAGRLRRYERRGERGGGRFERRGRGRIAVGCALPCARVGSARLGRRAGQAALTRLDWAAQ